MIIYRTQGKLQRLVRHWRCLASKCERELQRDADPKDGLSLAKDERISYEQAARTYCKCADELANAML